VSSVEWPTKRQSRGRKEAKETHNISTTARIVDSAKYYECFEVKEDRSITQRKHLRYFGKSLLNRSSDPFQSPLIVRETSKSHKRVFEYDDHSKNRDRGIHLVKVKGLE